MSNQQFASAEERSGARRGKGSILGKTQLLWLI